MGKRLLITSTDLMMIQFLVPHVRYLSENGFDIDIACSDVGGRMDEVREKLNDSVKAVHTVRLVRSPVSPSNIKGYKDMKQVVEFGKYDIIWTNEPVMGVVTRLASKNVRKKGTKVIYMVHGFHFYKGAPLFNWLLFYPIEKFAGHYCDSVVTVNREDFARAKKMNLPNVQYIHGIGINTDRLNVKENKSDIRKELNLRDDDFLVVSVGELNRNKNQKTVVKAIAELNDSSIHYILCGKGDQLENLKKLAAELKIEDKVHFLGYRTDVVDICSQSDVYVMPSKREGLPVASLEAMYCGLPLVTSNIRGLVDVMEDGKSGYMYDSDDVKGFAEGITKIKNNPKQRLRMQERNQKAVIPFCVENTTREVLKLISNYR